MEWNFLRKSAIGLSLILLFSSYSVIYCQDLPEQQSEQKYYITETQKKELENIFQTQKNLLTEQLEIIQNQETVIESSKDLIKQQNEIIQNQAELLNNSTNQLTQLNQYLIKLENKNLIKTISISVGVGVAAGAIGFTVGYLIGASK